MKAPVGTPEFVLKAVESLEYFAATNLKDKTMPTDRAAGYFTAVEDFKEMLREAASIEEEQTEKYRKQVIETRNLELEAQGQHGQPS